MAIIETSNQQLYIGKGPLDSKALVKTYADLLNEDSWVVDGISVAYNGMITAVWCDSDAANNGIYFLHDSAVKTARGTPNVAAAENWHKLIDISELSGFVSSLTSLEARLTALEEDSDVITYGYRSGFPSIGEPNKLYVAADEGKSYIWFNNDYLSVSSASSYEEPEVIYGGSAN